MARVMTAAQIAALSSGIIYPAIFAKLTFVDGTLYVWSGVGNITWGENTYLGMGSFGSISVIEEGATVEARGITISLSGIDPPMLAECLQNMRIGLPAVLYIGLFDATRALIDTPKICWAGDMDQVSIDVGGEYGTISINCENRLLQMNVGAGRRYTLEDGQMDHPGDLGFMWVSGLQSQTLYWGVASYSTNNL